MYKIPLTNSPNQTFEVTIPVNGINKTFVFNMWYNYFAEYWLLTISDKRTEQIIISNTPLLSSTYDFANMLRQYGYKMIGNAYIAPYNKKLSMPNNENIGSDFVLLWGDNDAESLPIS